MIYSHCEIDNNTMIKHVVMWRLKENAEGNDKSGNAAAVTDKLLKLKPVISEIDSIEIGSNINESDAAFDLVLITTHLDKQALATYIAHPAHQEAASFIGKVVAERNVVDFEY